MAKKNKTNENTAPETPAEVITPPTNATPTEPQPDPVEAQWKEGFKFHDQITSIGDLVETTLFALSQVPQKDRDNIAKEPRFSLPTPLTPEIVVEELSRRFDRALNIKQSEAINENGQSEINYHILAPRDLLHAAATLSARRKGKILILKGPTEVQPTFWSSSAQMLYNERKKAAEERRRNAVPRPREHIKSLADLF